MLVHGQLSCLPHLIIAEPNGQGDPMAEMTISHHEHDRFPDASDLVRLLTLTK